ncbi:MAG: hypothetical protein GEU93_18055 [Propionibacteriales bacterium]|nr:hypothetical protein [Propionibacteriales bacterium]
MASVTVGMLYPGYSAEDDYPRLESMLDSGVALPVQHTKMVVDAHRIDALLDWGRADRLAAGARALEPQRLDSIVWACTSGSFCYGWRGAHTQAEALAKDAGVPASSTALAFVHAAHALGVSRVAVVATYPDEVAKLFAEFLTEGDIKVMDVSSHGIFTAAEVGTIGEQELLAIATAGDMASAQALLLPDTALHTVQHLESLENELGKPVLTANQVSAWEGLRLAGYREPHDGLGMLFRYMDAGGGSWPE